MPPQTTSQDNLQNVATPATPAGDDDLAPPDDFGAAVLAEFAKRTEGTIAAAGDEGAPPGGWPSVDDAASRAATVPVGTTPVATPGEDTSASVPVGQADADVSAGIATPDAGITDTPAVPPAVSPAADGTDATEAASPSGYTWQFNDGATDREFTFSDADVQRALSLAAWAEQLPDATRTSIASVESGQAVAIPRADYDQYIAWRNQQSRSTRDADLSNLDVDPDVAKLIADLRDEVTQLGSQQQPGQPGQPGQPQPQVDAAVHANLDATAAQMSQAMADYAQVRGLTPVETEALMDQAVRAEVIPSLVDANSVVNPVTRQLLVPADMATVTQQALDFALVRNPALHTRVLSGQQTPAAPAVAVAAGAGAGAGAAPYVDPVNAKKARAASLATAPSGAVAPPASTVGTLSDQERVEAMANEIEAALKAS